MAQQHLDRLSAMDASFLLQEGATTHMHIGGVATFEGPAPTYDEFLAHIRSRLALVPRYRQKLAEPPLRTGRPLWVDDPNFNLGYHVRHTALPEPGSEEQLLNLTSRIFSQRLDRTKPLWEMWLVEGLEKKRFSLVTKTHHCLVDGVAGIDLMSTLFDLDPVPRRVDEEDWLPAPEPSGAQLLVGSLQAWVDTGREIAGGLLHAVTHPERTLERVREAAVGVGEVAWAGINPPPPTPLTGDIGPHRRFFVVRERLDDLKEIKDAFGGTVNDVVLAVVAGALATFMRSRGIRTEGLELRACVPVSVRTGGQEGTMGNRITQILCPLPVYIEDPVARLHFVREAMGGLKESKQALGAATIAGMEDFAPPDDPRPGLATAFLDADVHDPGHEHPGAAVPALRARSRAPGRRARGLPRRKALAGHGDHVLQRRGQLRADRRLRHAARPRGDRGGAQRVDRGAGRPGAPRARAGDPARSRGRRPRGEPGQDERRHRLGRGG